MAEMKHSDPEHASARNGADNASGLNNPSGMAGAPAVGSAFGGAFNGSDPQASAHDGSMVSAATGSSTSGQAEPAEVMQAAWDQVMDVLQAELSGPTYNNYLRHIKPVALRSDSFTLSVPSDFVRDWLVRRFAGRIEETLEQFLGRPMTLAFQTAPGTNRTVEAEEVAPAAEPELPEVRAAELQEQEERAQTPVNAPLNFPRGPGSGSQSAQSNKPPRDLAGLEDFSSSPLNRKYTFENFIVGRSNYVSHAAAWAVANAPAKGQYNPLFIYGGVGLGKTHLMQAIGHYINKSRNSPAEIVYVSGENFLYQVVRCIREDRMTAFRRMYRNVDIWLVDDIQYICNAERTEVEFFHIFNTLYDQGKQIVICSDKPPKDLELTENRLISRFEWGLISYIEAPDLEHRIAILQKRALAEGVNVDPAVLQYLAEKIRSNIRSLEGSLTRLLAMASLDGRKINLDLAAETVRHYSTAESEPVKVDVEVLIQVVADHFKMKVADILGKKRNKEIVMPRQVAMYLAREMASMSYPDIGRAFGRDYTTVIHSYEKIKSEIKKDSGLKNTVSELRSKAHARA
ncbi:MAG TPA: chromosomal replication initiator protein DnaA [Abditibacteriaceae bacterium]|jgi:chromosomal replication initiator protein